MGCYNYYYNTNIGYNDTSNTINNIYNNNIINN